MPGIAHVEIAQFLKQHHLAQSLTISEVQTLAEYVTHAQFHMDQVIAEWGTLGEALFFCVKGEMAIVHHTADGDEVEVVRVRDGEMAGEMSFFDRQPRSARILAKSDDTQVLVLTRARYQRLKVEKPYITVNILEQAIISLDHLFRNLSQNYTDFSTYIYGKGKR
ncbi:MAG: Crp/Fnr family transcriptional regulator [Acidithiobacillus ferrivorans]|jgi:CRP-like cAMP-binding protein|uniref:Cyclic nucleotide-binding protein n=1 Tax=Acidithiobacillus ferrivorans SS3 TaxID=743299 RepID=G0JPE5_9PROT|nr:cyclic nucleotide-binding domain-containing protein [Acidithiobacillus ferrivorans]AEM48486.1 cyclic nucleotide-binding protein [Acidithiobacillus ferrivorans SS3]MBU2765371.1 cyclic nucleotide-binding domain-containing protein [Acidithiobacillus ferrivorans]MBU2849882.1 cyclic nucleotide-binding domain-containing protein [Acidithiobacillus ferrivorans]OFA15515.1 cyclic nucleotide-binding protein [Acidithiobacillus ferrivorans]